MRAAVNAARRTAVRRALRTALRAAVILCAAMSITPRPASSQTTPADSAQAAYRRAQRLVNDGQGAEGRALIDSLLDAAEPRSPEEAEALFWRATLAESWEAAQRDYLRIMLEHERSPRAGDAMLRLAQGESARGDRDAAIRYLERLAREAPESAARGEAGLWQGRILMERGDRAGGCSVLRDTRARVRAGAVELENQYEYLLRGCPEPGVASSVAPTVAPSDAPTPSSTSNASPPTPAPTPATDPVPPVRRDSAPRPAPTTGAPTGGPPLWSVQVAALSTESEANAIVTKLRDRGYDARVDGSIAPFRVRFGKFPTRAAATAALERYKSRERADAFLVEVPRG